MIKIDSIGRINLPKDMRKRYGFNYGVSVVAVDTGEGILIKPAEGIYKINESEMQILREIVDYCKTLNVLDDDASATLSTICRETEVPCPNCDKNMYQKADLTYYCSSCSKE
jgi:bifunctional DNA-binding transcriptional regulator/antitoxin component of YhaV-PrlF toxin-antitoxin module